MKTFVVMCVVANLFVAISARAQDAEREAAHDALPQRAVLRAPECDLAIVSDPAFLRVLGIELRGDGVTTVDSVAHNAPLSEGASLALIAIDALPCTEDATLLAITIDDLATQKSVRRTVDLSDIAADARARTLALAIAELLRASWAELALPDADASMWPIPSEQREALVARLRMREPTPAPPPSPVNVAPPLPNVRPDTTPTFFLDASLEETVFPSNARGLLGARVGFSVLIKELPLRLRLDAGFGRSVSHHPEGDISMNLFTGGVGIFLTSTRRFFFFEVGPRFQLGWGWENGDPASASVLGNGGGAVIAMLGLACAVGFRVQDSMFAVLGVEAGAVTAGLNGNIDGATRSAMAGEYINVRLAYGVGF